MAILGINIGCQMKSLAGWAVRRNGGQAAIPQVQRLSAGEIRRHAAMHQTIKVVAGTAWVSVSGKDYVVQVGESLNLPCDPYPALISSVHGQRVTYQLM